MEKYQIIDLHCDVLMKLAADKSLDFASDERLDINLKRLKEGQVKVQAMALFISPDIPSQDQFVEAEKQIEAYQTRVLTQPGVVQLKSLKDIETLKADEIGTFLTLEGVECLGNDLTRLDYLLSQGVLAVGMTWNKANLACDGIKEPRGGGLTELGYKIVERLNQANVFVDVSHISVKGFDDVLASAKHVIASHSNAQAVCGHVRNLSDAQIKALVKRHAPIHLVYCPDFVADKQPATVPDLIKHIDHMMGLGAKTCLGLGSDFDGIKNKVEGLTHAGQHPEFITQIKNHFGEDVAQGITHQNFINYIKNFF